jgi:hypothetical protein
VISCPFCKALVPTGSSTCPFCVDDISGLGGDKEAVTERTSAGINAKAIISAVVFLLLLYFGGGLEKKVASGFIDQYNIAKRSGTPIDVCVHAGLVSAAFLQAKDDANYQVWKATEAAACKAAGMPQR